METEDTMTLVEQIALTCEAIQKIEALQRAITAGPLTLEQEASVLRARRRELYAVLERLGVDVEDKVSPCAHTPWISGGIVPNRQQPIYGPAQHAQISACVPEKHEHYEGQNECHICDSSPLREDRDVERQKEKS